MEQAKKGIPGWVWAVVAFGLLALMVPLCLVGAGAVMAVVGLRTAQDEAQQARVRVQQEEVRAREEQERAMREQQEALERARREEERLRGPGAVPPPPGGAPPSGRDPLQGLEGL